jgi:hypothetical protein
MWSSDLHITWELVRTINTQALLLDQSLPFNKVPRRLVGTLKFERQSITTHKPGCYGNEEKRAMTSAWGRQRRLPRGVSI